MLIYAYLYLTNCQIVGNATVHVTQHNTYVYDEIWAHITLESWIKVLLHLLEVFSTVKNMREIQHGYDWQ